MVIAIFSSTNSNSAMFLQLAPLGLPDRGLIQREVLLCSRYALGDLNP